MPTVQECEQAVVELMTRLGNVDLDVRRRHLPDRTISARVVAPDCVFWGRLVDGELRDVVRGEPAAAHVRLTVSGRDLLALRDGTLRAGEAWSAGRLRVQASVLDLLRLRAAL